MNVIINNTSTKLKVITQQLQVSHNTVRIQVRSGLKTFYNPAQNIWQKLLSSCKVASWKKLHIQILAILHYFRQNLYSERKPENYDIIPHISEIFTNQRGNYYTPCLLFIASFYFKVSVRCQKLPKYYDHDCLEIFFFLFTFY